MPERVDIRGFLRGRRYLAVAPGIMGVHLCIADRAASGIETEEKKGRPKNAVPALVLMVEGSADREALETACAGISIPGAERGLYRLQHLIESAHETLPI